MHVVQTPLPNTFQKVRINTCQYTCNIALWLTCAMSEIWHYVSHMALCMTCSTSDIAVSVIGTMLDIHISDGCHVGTCYVWLIEHSWQTLTVHIAHNWVLWLSILLVKPFWASNSVKNFTAWNLTICILLYLNSKGNTWTALQLDWCTLCP